MTSDRSQSSNPTSRRGLALASVAAGAALGLLLVAFGVSVGTSDAVSEPLRVDTAPIPAVPATHVAALDAGVDWSRVEAASDVAPMAVAAYER